MAVTGLELRDDGDVVTFTGYASHLLPALRRWAGARKTVDPAAFKRTLGQKPDVRLLISHDEGYRSPVPLPGR